jgi:hypothetical protein
MLFVAKLQLPPHTDVAGIWTLIYNATTLRVRENTNVSPCACAEIHEADYDATFVVNLPRRHGDFSDG